MLAVERLGEADHVARYRVIGALSDGRAVDAVVELDLDARDGWFAEESVDAAGVEPGDEAWDEMMAAIGDATV